MGVEAGVAADEAAKVAVMEAAITAALLQEGQITELLSLVSRRHNFISSDSKRNSNNNRDI